MRRTVFDFSTPYFFVNSALFTSRFSGQDHAVFAIIIPHSEEM